MENNEKLTNRKIQAKNTHDKVYSVAIKLFEEKGFENITVDEVCMMAEVSTGTFYNVFKSKYAILDHIFELADDFFLNTVKGQIQEGTIQERILLYFNFYAEYNLDRGLTFVKQLYTGKNNLFAKKNRSMQIVLKEVIEDAQSKGELSSETSAMEIVEFLFVCVRGLVYDWCLKNGEFNLKEATHDFVTKLLKTI